MTAERFDVPAAGRTEAVRFPAVARDTLANGVRVWVTTDPASAVVSAALVVAAGSADDPPDRPGLVSLVGDLLDEGAGLRDAIGFADALARLGSRLVVDVGPDVTTISIASLARHFEATLGLAADALVRPHFADADFARARDLRTNRLRQLRQVPGTLADRAFIAGVYGAHPYGHGTLGTTRAIEALTLDEVRSTWAQLFVPARTALVVAGGVDARRVLQASQNVLGNDLRGRFAKTVVGQPAVRAVGSVYLIDRPGAPQSEVRVGHEGPRRDTADYHALLTLNAVLGGQFTSRLNRNLRETRGITYGVRSTFDFRRSAGALECSASVQADATALAVTEILGELRAIQAPGNIQAEELSLAQASLTRGYVREFETAAHLSRALSELVAYDLAADTFDRFVPAIEALASGDLSNAAGRVVRPEACTVAVVGDAARVRGPLEALGRPVEMYEPEF